MRLMSVPGGGMQFVELEKSKELRAYREKYLSPIFQSKGVVHENVARITDVIRAKLNFSHVPLGVVKEPLLQACWHVHRCGTTVANPLDHMARLWFSTFGPTLAQVEKSFDVRLKFLSKWTFRDVIEKELVPKEDIKFGLPIIALQNLYEDRRLRTVLGLDKLCESLTLTDVHADRAMAVAAKIKALLLVSPYPPGARVAVIGEDAGHDLKLHPAGTDFYDLIGKTLNGTHVSTLDINNVDALAHVMDSHDAVLSDACPSLDNASIDMSKLVQQCAHGKNETMLANLCRAAMAAPNLKWLALKMFLAPAQIFDIPNYLVPLMHKWGFYILKSGKLHNDEFYIVFSESAPKRLRAYWNIQMLRIAHYVELGHEVTMRGTVTGTLNCYRTPEAMEGWVSLGGSEIPFSMPRGTGYKDKVAVEDYQHQLASLWSQEEYSGIGTVGEPDVPSDAGTILFPPEARGTVPDSLIDRRPAGARNTQASVAALEASNNRAGVQSAWTSLPVEPPATPLTPPSGGSGTTSPVLPFSVAPEKG